MGFVVPIYCNGKVVGNKRVYSDKMLIAFIKHIELANIERTSRRELRRAKPSKSSVDLSRLSDEELIMFRKIVSKLNQPGQL
jgi:hypothetical protein